MRDQRNIIGTGDHENLLKQLFPGYQNKVNPGYTHKDQYFDTDNINRFRFRLTEPKMKGTTAYEVPAQAALDSLYSADYLKKYTPKVDEVNARRAKLNTNLSPISPYFNVLLPDNNIEYRDTGRLAPLNRDAFISMNSSAYFPFTQALNFGVQEAVDGGKHAKFLDPKYAEDTQRSNHWSVQNGFAPLRPDFNKKYATPHRVFKSHKDHELGHFVNYPNEGIFDLTKYKRPQEFYNEYFATPEGHTYGKYLKFPKLRTTKRDILNVLDHGNYNQVPSEFYNFLGQVKRWGPKFGIKGTMDTSDMAKHRQAMKDTVKHIMNLKPQNIDELELLRAHNYLNTAKSEYPGNMFNQNDVKRFMESKYREQAKDEQEAKELIDKDPNNYYKNIQDLNQYNPQEVIPSMILDQVSDDDLKALVDSSANGRSLRGLMYS